MLLPKPFITWTTYAQHSGMDFPYAKGRAILASGNGRVIFKGWSGKEYGDRWTPGKRAGNSISVLYDNGVELRYSHLDHLKDSPAVGTRVSEGDYLGPVGDTGYSFGNHLHLECWVNGILRTGTAFWNYVDNNRVVSAKTTPKPASVQKPKEDEEEMPIAVLERTNSALTKCLYDVKAGRAIRPISREENTSFRKAARTGGVVYVTVSDEEYKSRGGV